MSYEHNIDDWKDGWVPLPVPDGMFNGDYRAYMERAVMKHVGDSRTRLQRSWIELFNDQPIFRRNAIIRTYLLLLITR